MDFGGGSHAAADSTDGANSTGGADSRLESTPILAHLSIEVIPDPIPKNVESTYLLS